MVHPANNYGFRTNERFHCEAQLDGKGHSLFKSCIKAVGPLIGSLRARLSAPTDFVAPIVDNKEGQRRTTMSSKERLAVNADSHAELAIISWMDH